MRTTFFGKSQVTCENLNEFYVHALLDYGLTLFSVNFVLLWQDAPFSFSDIYTSLIEMTNYGVSNSGQHYSPQSLKSHQYGKAGFH